MKITGIALLLGFALGVPPVMYSQGTTGRLSGVVTDKSGAIVPGATVQITDVRTNETRSALTNSAGLYEFPFLPLGLYKVEAQMKGFRTFTQTGIEITGTVPVQLPITLEVGQSTQTVQVAGVTPLLETGQTSNGATLSRTKLNELPIFKRSTMMLLNFIPGSAANDNANPGTGAATRIDGSRMGMSQIYLDGVNINTQFSSGADVVLEPDIEALQDVGVITNNFSAQYGRAQGAVVVMSMKSGTNQFHGEAYEFWNNAVLNAKNFFAETLPKPPSFGNNFGGTFGGPILHNKLFFFAAYNGIRNLTPVIGEFGQVPTAQMRNGDFSQLGTPIFDPTTTQSQAPYGRQAFSGSIIPPGRLNASAMKAVALYPEPNVPGIGANYIATPGSHTRMSQLNVKIDYDIKSKDRLYGRVTYAPSNNSSDPIIPNIANTNNATSTGYYDALQFNETHIFRPNLLNEVRVGFQTTGGESAASQQALSSYLGDEIGIPPNDSQEIGFPNLLFGGCVLCTLGEPTPFSQSSQKFVDANDTMTLIKGRQTLTFGGSVQHVFHALYVSTNCPAGCYNFTGNFTNNPANSADTGYSLADFELGLPISVQQGFNVPTDFHYTQGGAFLEDDIKLNLKLTLNLGVRWDYYGALDEAKGRVSEYDPATNLIVQKNPPDSPNNHLFVPRIGLAYRFTPKTVFRGAYGISTYPKLFGISNLLPAEVPFARVQTIQNTGSFYSTLTAPAIPFGNELPVIPQEAFPVTPNPTISANFFPNNMPTPYWQMWNATVQHQLMENFDLTVSYVGTRGVHLDSSNEVNCNLPAASEYGPDNLFGGLTFQQRLPYPDLGTLTCFGNRASSEYSGLQTIARWRPKHGLWFSAYYVWEKAMTDMPGNCCNEEFRQGVGGTSPQIDASNWRLQWAPDGSTPYNIAEAQANYELPFGSGKEFLNRGGLIGRAVGGWQLGGVLLLRSGDQFGVSSADAQQHLPNRICNGNLPSSQRTLQHWFNTSCFVNPSPIYSLGDAGFSIINGPRNDNLDASLFKNFHVSERVTAQFRADFYDATNTPHFFLGRGVTLGTPTFGQVTNPGDNQRGLSLQPERTGQLSLRISF